MMLLLDAMSVAESGPIARNSAARVSTKALTPPRGLVCSEFLLRLLRLGGVPPARLKLDNGRHLMRGITTPSLRFAKPGVRSTEKQRRGDCRAPGGLNATKRLCKLVEPRPTGRYDSLNAAD